MIYFRGLRKIRLALCGTDIFIERTVSTLQKLHYETPVVELLQFEAEDIIRTSSESNSGIIGPPDFVGTAPGFEWGEWP